MNSKFERDCQTILDTLNTAAIVVREVMEERVSAAMPTLTPEQAKLLHAGHHKSCRNARSASWPCECGYKQARDKLSLIANGGNE